MKDKITISLSEDILSKIDNDIKAGKQKNRSQVIENILKERYGNFSQVTVIIFCHDYKWDNRPYPFDIAKGLLLINGESIISRQVQIFSKAGITNIIITIPPNSTEVFSKELKIKYKNISFSFIELDPELKTGSSLKEVFKKEHTLEELIIANGDIYYGSLDLESYFNYHKEQKSDFSFLLKFVANPEQLGNVLINGNKVIKFVERPKANPFYLTNSGLYITTRSFLDKNDFGDYLEYDLFTKLPELGNIIGYIHTHEWEHIQNDSAYERVNGWNI
ncbi:MAG: sugar phosphate nucleotidyltransferase [Candidatus Gracilibacteria bacterium]|nr:sugar phosphate nucleotidyltransferase [Candidatus Gracilibacteria bacterium]